MTNANHVPKITITASCEEQAPNPRLSAFLYELIWQHRMVWVIAHDHLQLAGPPSCQPLVNVLRKYRQHLDPVVVRALQDASR